jgi:anti-sigma28 factor (negative regulator of flagellin synthesis)
LPERARRVPEARPGSNQDLLDHVEISQEAQALSDAGQEAGIRADKVAQIREAIANGTYLTEEKITITADRLLEVLRESLVK